MKRIEIEERIDVLFDLYIKYEKCIMEHSRLH